MDKSKKTVLIVSLVTIVLLGSAYFLYSNFFKEDSNPNEDTTTSYTIEEGNFSLYTEYIKDSEWQYTVTGTVPTPCHEVNINTQVMESFPEQVVVNVTVITNPEEVCTQVIQDINKTGTFQASEEAKISLNVAELTKSQIGD